MCDPITVAVTMQTVSTVAKGYQAKQQGKYENKIAKYNARQEENEATQLRNKGVEEENIVRQKTAQLVAKQRAQIGAAGVELETGSALDIQESESILGEVDAMRVRKSFTQKAESMEEGAKLTLAQGEAAEKMGKQAFTASLLSATAGVMSSGVADKWFTPESEAVIKAGGGSLSSFA